MSNEEQKEEAGARSFSVFLTKIDEGRLHAELSETLKKVADELQTQANSYGKAKGELGLKLKLEVEETGVVSVFADVTTKIPKPKRGRSVFWTDAHGNLHAENPRQQKLPLREVPRAEKPRELVVDAPAPARGV